MLDLERVESVLSYAVAVTNRWDYKFEDETQEDMAYTLMYHLRENGFKEMVPALLSELAAARAENERLMNLAVKAGIWKKAPCCLCGYSGAGYHQPATHKCAALAAKLEGG